MFSCIGYVFTLLMCIFSMSITMVLWTRWETWEIIAMLINAFTFAVLSWAALLMR